MKHFKNETALKPLPVPGDSLPAIFLKQSEKYGESRVALRRRKGQNWEEFTWKAYRQNVEQVAAALKHFGVVEDDKICIISGNCPEWLFIAVAVHSIGAWLVPIYPNSTAEQVQYITEHSDAKFLFVQNAEQLAKTRSWSRSSSNLQKIIQIFGDPDAGPTIIKWSTFIHSGSEILQKNPDFLAEQIARISSNSPGGFIYTSGTTGPPKGVMLTQKNLVFETASLLTVHDYLFEEDTLSFLPLSHIAEQLQNFCVGICAAFRVSFVTSIETVRDDLQEIRPTIFFSVPRLYEKVRAGILETVASAPASKKNLFYWALKAGESMRQARNGTHTLSSMAKIKARLAEKIVFGKLRARLGLDRAKFFISGAAPLPVAVSKFFGAIGIDIYEAFGQTECTGVCTATLPGKTVPGAVGPVLPGCEIRIADDGEILTTGDNIFSGYWKDEAATSEAIQNGWLHTGDVGHFDETGYLHITDRKKDILVTAGGKNIAPQNLESLLKCYPGISQVTVIGDQKKYLTCLITLDKDGLNKICERLGLATLSMREAAEHKSIIEVVQGYIDKMNASLARYETIKYFRILPQDFAIETGELTPTLKVKRRVVNEKFKDVIDSMYNKQGH